MGIGKRIKEARLNLNLTQDELGELVGVTGSAITNYEKETSHPKEGVMYKLIDALQVDANYLFQDVVKLPSKDNDITLAEHNHIKKYRDLDDYGKDLVTTVLDKEHTRCTSGTETETTVNIEPVKTISLKHAYNKASAGDGFLDLGDMDTEIDVEYNELTHKADFCVTVTGRSMEPKFKDGDMLLVRQQPAVDENEIGIFIVDDKGYVKINGEKELISLNKKYPNIPKTENTICFGKVVGVLKKGWIK